MTSIQATMTSKGQITIPKMVRDQLNLSPGSKVYLLIEAVKAGGGKSREDTVTQALQEYLQRRRMQSVIDAFGTIDFDEEVSDERSEVLQQIR